MIDVTFGRPVRGVRAAISALTIGAALATFWIGPVYAQVSPPTPDKPWGGCLLSQETIASLAQDMEDANPGGNAPKIAADVVNVDAVIVLRLDARNWGQELFFNNGTSAGFTARIVCSAVNSVTEEREDDRFPPSGEVNILNADETLGIRAERSASNKVARLCLTSNTTATDTNLEVDPVTCFRLELTLAP